MNTSVAIRILLFLATPAVLFLAGCGKTHPEDAQCIRAYLTEDQGRLMLVLHNLSGKEFMLCRRNFYLPLDYIDMKRYPDTTELTFEQIFGKKLCRIKRTNVTMSDFAPLPPDKEIRLPVDLRCVSRNASLGDTVFVSVRFMNIDPFMCSRIEVKKYKQEIQDYCELFHYVPSKDLNYWSGEVKTPYYAYALGRQ